MKKIIFIFQLGNIYGHRTRKDSEVDLFKSLSGTFGLDKVDTLIKNYDDKDEGENLLEEAVKEDKEEWKNHWQNIDFVKTEFSEDDLKDLEKLKNKIMDRVSQKETQPEGEEEVDWANKKWSVDDIDVDIVEDVASWAQNTDSNTKGGNLENVKNEINKFANEAKKGKTKNGQTEWHASIKNLLKKGQKIASESWEKYNGCKWMKKEIKDSSLQKFKGKKMKKMLKNMKMWCVHSQYCSMIVPKEVIKFKCGDDSYKIATESGVLKKKQFLLNFDSCDDKAAQLIDAQTDEKIMFNKNACTFLN